MGIKDTFGIGRLLICGLRGYLWGKCTLFIKEISNMWLISDYVGISGNWEISGYRGLPSKGQNSGNSDTYLSIWDI